MQGDSKWPHSSVTFKSLSILRKRLAHTPCCSQSCQAVSLRPPKWLLPLTLALIARFSRTQPCNPTSSSSLSPKCPQGLCTCCSHYPECSSQKIHLASFSKTLIVGQRDISPLCVDHSNTEILITSLGQVIIRIVEKRQDGES